MAASQFNFLNEYLVRLLEENKISLTPEQQKTYLPQLLSHAQLRLGIELLPKLSPGNKERFAQLAENEETSADEWRQFWYAAIPTFEEDVKNILMKFSDRVTQLLGESA